MPRPDFEVMFRFWVDLLRERLKNLRLLESDERRRNQEPSGAPGE